MTDLGDLLGLDPAPPPGPRGRTGRRRVRCRNPRCRRWVFVDRLVYGYGEECAGRRGLIVRRRRRTTPGQTGPDLLAELAAAPVPLPTLAELPPPARCPSCACCPADLCAAAHTAGVACLLRAAPGPDPAALDAVLRCPCAPATCHCTPPAHVRGIARCQHGQRAADAQPSDPDTRSPR